MSGFGSFRPGTPGGRKGDDREALLSKVGQERAERDAKRARGAAALAIQRAWRRHVAVSKTAALARGAWDARFAPRGAEALGRPPTAGEVAELLLPPLLFLILPRGRRECFALNPGDQARLRGCLGLLLGSLGSREAGACYFSLSTASGERGRAWGVQAARLARLCALALEAAFTAPPEVPGISSGGAAQGAYGDKLLQAGCARVLVVCADLGKWGCYGGLPAPPPEAAAAAARLSAALAASPHLPRAAAAAARAVALDPPSPPGGGVAGSLIAIAAGALEALPEEGPAGARFAAALVAWVLPVPRLPSRLPIATLQPLLRPAVFRRICRALLVPFCSLLSVGGGGGVANAGEAATWACCNLVAMAAHPSSPPLTDPGLIADYAGALCSLLEGDLSTPPPAKSAAAAQHGGSREAAYDALLLLIRRQHMMSLFNGAGSGSGSGAGAVARVYSGLLRVLPRLLAQESTAERVAAACAPVLQSIAFAPGVLPRLWAYLARELRVPGEVPNKVAEVAGAGVWDVEALRGGAGGAAVSEHGSAGLALFCRAYQSLLMVLDDDDFYEREEPFRLEQQRAISAALNTLVYHTHAPGAGAGGGKSPAREAVAAHAPALLRSLYERDTRQPFCPPGLWLAPAAGRPLPPPDQVAAGVRAEGSGAGGAGAAPARVLMAVPHAVPFVARAEIFQELVKEERRRLGLGLSRAQGGPRPTRITVRRGMEVEGAFAALSGPRGKEAIRGALDISYLNQQGLEEAGLDYGGLMKEFLVETTKAGFDPNYGLFEAGEGNLLRPRPAAQHIPEGLPMLELLGRLVGRCMLEGLLMDVAFAPFFVSKILGRYCFLDELAGLDPEVHRSLVSIKRYEGDAADLGLDFTVSEDVFGAVVTHELRPRGGETPVMDENKLLYVHLVADWHLNKRVHAVSSAFIGGLLQVIPPSWLRMFNPREFNQLLSGGHVEVDVADLRAHVKYSGGYADDSRSVKLFWEVVGKFNHEERSALLKFVTTCGRPPLLGFKHMAPQFTIHKVECESSFFAAIGGKDAERLPSASTCFNTLKLPNYKRAGTMREKLLYAIRSGAGFELS